jgi:hypothetical protein
MLLCPFHHLISMCRSSAERYPIKSPHPFVGLDPATIEWVYIIEARRHATKKEIANLCAGKPVKAD